jgi:hypothetical protein
MAGAPVIPAPHDDDDDDVAWALQTAAIQWQRGGKADAVVWLRRAVDAAIAAGNPARTKELTRLATDVADRVTREITGGRETAPSESGEAVDALLAGEPIPGQGGPPGPRVSAHSLSGEIPIDFEEITDVSEDFDEEDADTLPPPRRSPPPSRAPSQAPAIDELDDVEQDVSGEDLFSAPPPPEELPEELEEEEDYQEVEDVSEESFVGAVAEPESMEMLTGDEDGVVHSSGFLDEGASEDADPADALHDELTKDASSPARPPASGVSSGRPQEEGAQEPADEPTTPWSSRPPPPDEPVSGVSVPPASRLPEGLDEADEADGETAEIPVYGAAESPGGDSPQDEASIASVPPVSEGVTDTDVAPRAPMLSAPVIAPAVDDILLEGVRGFEDLPEDMQRLIVGTAVLTTLSADEEVGSFGAALVTRGKVGIMAAVADVSAAVAAAGEVVFTQGTLEEKVPLRVVALEDGTVVASWTPAVLATAFADCPWVADELRQVADRFQALAGATLGLLGERLDDTVRDMVFSRLDVKAFEAGETIVAIGKTIPGLHIVGSGRVELDSGEAASPGEFLFAAEVLGGGKAHATARAGKTGALLLVASRAVAHEMLVSVPPLLEILAG